MQTVAFKVGKGKHESFVLIETNGRGTVPRNAGRKKVQQAAKELEEHLDPIVTVAESIRKKLTELNNPGKISIEFGIELGVELDFVITAGSAKGNFKVTMEWVNEKPEAPHAKAKI